MSVDDLIPRVKLAIVDDDTAIRDGMPLLLPSIDVVAQYAGVDELIDARPTVDLVLLDLHLNGTGVHRRRQGRAAVRLAVAHDYCVLIYTNERRRRVLVECLAAGASGVLHKAEPISALESAIADVVAGDTVITQALVGLAELAERRGELAQVSPRQREVLSGRARGESYGSIARRLYITEGVAHEHMQIVTRKFADFLRSHSAADLERYLGFAPGDLMDDG